MNYNNFFTYNFINLKQYIISYNYDFDEDLFIDTCLKSIKKSGLTDSELKKYISVSYINNYKSKRYIPFTSLENINLISKPDLSQYIYELYDILINEISEKFGEDLTRNWVDHFCKNIKYKDLENIGVDYNSEFKKIKRYILNHLCKYNEKIKILLDIIREGGD